MSPIGRAFVVLNLFLAAAFLGWASNALYTTEDYKGQLESEKAAHEATRTDLQGQIDALQAKSNQTEDDLRTRTEQRGQFQAEAESLRSQLEEAKRANDTMQGNLSNISATLGDFKDDIATISAAKDSAEQKASEAETARQDAVEAQQKAELAQRDAEEQAKGLQQTIDDMKVAMNDVQKDKSHLETQLQVLIEATGVSPELITTQPLISGRVLEARYDLPPGLVMLNVGKNKDVRRGYTFEVYSGGTYKGQVRVVDVQDDVCAAVVVNAVEGTKIGQGDSASTRI